MAFHFHLGERGSKLKELFRFRYQKTLLLVVKYAICSNIADIQKGSEA